MKFKILILNIASCIYINANAQEINKKIDSLELNQVVISGNKYSEKKQNLVQKIDVITAKNIAIANAPSTGDLLMQSGNVFVQKSQQGGSSPVIRGFEANRILLNIDGVRMNNAIYRSGHLQNVITIDQNMLESVEIIYGPASTMYGSDALGGVLSFTTKKIKFNSQSNGAKLTDAAAFVRFASANLEKTASANFTIASDNFGSLTSITASDFGDLRAGANRSKVWGNVGLRNFNVQTFNGIDSMVANPNPQVQLGSGYSQIDVLQKFSLNASKHNTQNLNFQYSTSTEVPRYDRLSEVNVITGKANQAQWYYGPQKRFMTAYKSEWRGMNGFITGANLNLNYQNIFESRNTRGYQKTNLVSREEKLNVYGFDANIQNKTDNNEIVLGLDAQINDVKSKGTQTNIITNLISTASSRYPDGGSQYKMFGMYAQDILKVVPNRLIFNAGLRLNYVKLDAKFVDKTFFSFPFNDMHQSNWGLNSNLGMVFLPNEDLKLSIGYSSGFKAPNVDDASKVFESAQGANIIVPNPNLVPEVAHNIDGGIEYNENGKIIVGINAYYTKLTNALVIDFAKFNGADSINFDGVNTAVVTTTNKAFADIYGLSGNVKFKFLEHFTLTSTLSYTAGTYDGIGTLGGGNATSPMDHIPPVFGRTSLAYNQSNWSAEIYSLYNGAKKLEDYNTISGEDNIQYATPNGMPAWATFNVRGSYKVNKHFTIQAAIENILDTHYRHFASGISAPGTNFIATLRYNK